MVAAEAEGRMIVALWYGTPLWINTLAGVELVSTPRRFRHIQARKHWKKAGFSAWHRLTTGAVSLSSSTKFQGVRGTDRGTVRLLRGRRLHLSERHER